MDDLPRPLPLPGEWHRLAACRGMGPELFYPERGQQVDQPRQVCERCPVRQECLEYALRNRVRHGVWGGKSEVERRHLRRRSVVPRSARIVIPAAECPSCGEESAVVPYDSHRWLCLDCRIQWPALDVG